MCFQAFLNEFSETYSNSLNILQVDNGSPHLAKKLIIPENSILLFQPSYSSDVNLIERVWQSVKDKFSWLTVGTLDELRNGCGLEFTDSRGYCLAHKIRFYSFCFAE